MIGINYSDYNNFGCPNCGCDSTKPGNWAVYGEQTATCRHCNFEFLLMPDGRTISEVKIGTGRRDVNDKDIVENVFSIPHPRQGVEKWTYVLPDIRPDFGEYWKPRGIGYDLSGFVKSKPAGERLLEIVKEVLNKEDPETRLDYRENEPFWIQFKFSKNEFNLEKLYVLTKDKGIITPDIIKQCKI
jgi:hypothetical protein